MVSADQMVSGKTALIDLFFDYHVLLFEKQEYVCVWLLFPGSSPTERAQCRGVCTSHR